MVQEDAPSNHNDWDDLWNPENDEGEDQFPEEVGPLEDDMLMFQNLLMAIPSKFFKKL